MTIVSDATTWSVTYDRQNEDPNIFMIQATAYLGRHDTDRNNPVGVAASKVAKG
jgi:hypothetical protein